ncbi:MAG: metal ABC transporter permease [Myxococcota bacterium]
MPEATLGWADFFGAWEIFRDPVLCGIFAGAALGVLGVYIVLRRVVFMAAVLSQSAGLGVALAFWVGMQLDRDVEPMLGAVLLCFVATLLVTVRPERVHLSREALLGTAWVGAGAAALVVGEAISVEAHDISSILFGSAVLVRPVDLQLVTVAAALTLVAHGWLRRGLVFAAFDPDVARVQGLPVTRLDLVLWLVVALTVSVSTRALGALPVFALSVLPALAGLLATSSLTWVFPTALLVGMLSGGLGYVLAFFESWPVGASQTLVALGFVAVAGVMRMLRRG